MLDYRSVLYIYLVVHTYMVLVGDFYILYGDSSLLLRFFKKKSEKRSNQVSPGQKSFGGDENSFVW